MGMLSPQIAGQVPDVISDVTRKAPGNQPSPPSRNPSIAGSLTRKDSGLNKRVVTARARSTPGLIVRRKLPWLDGGKQSKPGQIPGAFDTEQQSPEPTAIPTGDATSTTPGPGNSAVVGRGKASDSRHASIASLGPDPSLRAIGSTPSLRQRARSGEFKRLSLNSDHRPGVKPILSKEHAKQALAGKRKNVVKDEDYTPSEYSTTISSDPEPMPASLPKRDPASYERLVQKAVTRKATAHEPAHIAQGWLQAQLEVSSEDVSPTTDEQRHRKASSCRSCDAAPMEKPRKLQETGQPLRKASSSQPSPREIENAPEIPPKATPTPLPRNPTLRALPSHLWAPSSSSTDVPSHLMTSTDESSRASPVPPPRRLSSPVLSSQVTLKSPALTAAKSQDLRRETKKVDRAITGLDHLMDQAVTVANEAAHNGRSDEVAYILNSATAALRRASTTFPSGHGRMSEPLRLSPRESGASSANDSDRSVSDASSVHGRASVDTAPTHFTKSARSSQEPLAVDPRWATGRQPSVEKIDIERYDRRPRSSSGGSIARTPPRLYQPPSADSIVRDFAYAKLRNNQAQAARSLSTPANYGAAADFYNDHGESVATQPGIRRSIALEKVVEKTSPDLPPAWRKPKKDSYPRTERAADKASGDLPKSRRFTKGEMRELEHRRTNTIPSVQDWHNDRLRDNAAPPPPPEQKQRKRGRYQPHVSDFFENAYYRHPEHDHAADPTRKVSTVTDTRSVAPSTTAEGADSKHVSGPSQAAIIPSRENLSLKHPHRKHISLREGQGFSLGRYHRRQPIAREWNTVRKRITAAIACINTVFIGLIAGIYAGEVPRIQYQIADVTHRVILGNVLLFVGLGLTTLIFWPLPLLHGRKPYTLLAFALMLPLQFPQALAVSNYRDPENPIYRCGLLIPRVLTGLAMGFANINQLPTLFDLFGVSLMSEVPHQEIVVYDDVRRQGGGVGIWLGIWSWCFVGSLSLGFCIGACIISKLDPSWGFYIVVILLAFFLLVNVIAPETRRAPYRRSIAHFFDEDDKLRRRVARGEVMLHISNDGPKWWFQEVWAGIILTKRMIFQPGFFVLMAYIAWIYAQVTLVILFLGALLSRDYQWRPQYVGLASLSLAIGALLAMPLAKASFFSRSRWTPQRTDSMTMRAPHLTWTSHLVRRSLFTLMLPFAGLAYTLSAGGPPLSWVTPTIFCGLVGFLSNLAIAECVGLIMETFDTCDLQPGVNQKHRLQSMAETTRRRRTNYSSFPRVCAGFFAAQALGFFLAAAATGVSGDVTRALGAQEATAITAAILLGITVFLLLVLWRWKQVQVIPESVFRAATKKGSLAWGGTAAANDPEWKPVIIGNPSGKMRRVNLLELASLSRWTEIRRLNKLVKN